MSTDFNEEIEQKLLDLVQSKFGMEIFTPGLERTKPLFYPFVNSVKKKNIKVTIIAGTNGKGQTAHTLSHFLSSINRKTALWTSPHIMSIRERFTVNGINISYEELEFEMKSAISELEKNYQGLRVSFYEFLFLVFLRYVFGVEKEKILDHLILEVGLGGRLDAVNHFDSDCTSITSISRDHQSILGNRYDTILSEKIAVARAGKPLFTQFNLSYLNQIVKKYTDENGVIWRPINKANRKLSNYYEENQKMALELFSFLEPHAALPHVTNIPFFKGRREEMTFKGNTFIFIGAHNIDGIRRMVEFFSKTETTKIPSKVLISFSKRPSSELEVMLKTLLDYFGKDSKLLLTNFLHPKAIELEEMKKLESKFNKINKGMLDFVTNWKVELQESNNQQVLVCGSYYFIGEVQRFISSNS